MIDIHSHILNGIDDGSKSLSESVEIIRKASNSGVTDIIVTPHFILGSKYNSDNNTKQEILNNLKKEIKKENINTNLYLGNEVYVELNMPDLIKDNKITTLNNSRYLLFELPFHSEFKGLRDVVFKLKLEGYEPIIAHPERYSLFQNNPEIVLELLNQGALFQSNIGSFYGHYGKDAKKLFILLLKHHAIHFIGSDIHHSRDVFYDELKTFKNDLKKYISDDEIEELLEKNSRHILNNEKFDIRDAIPLKKGLFGKWK